MKKIIQNVLIIGAVLVMPVQGMAWGVLGHRIIGQIAQSYLKPKARTEIQKILGTESVAMASNWMDFVKSDPSFKHMNNWHYIDLMAGLNYQQEQAYLASDTTTNLFTKFNYVVKELKKKNIPLEMKQVYLRILVHLVGDMHQPLHCRGESSGGNEIKITWFNNPSNLHTLWDSELINFQQLSFTEYTNAINHPSTTQVNFWQKDAPSKWVFESYQIGDDILKEAANNTKYSYKYNFDHIKTIDQQLLKGGVRLAGLLNQIFAI